MMWAASCTTTIWCRWANSITRAIKVARGHLARSGCSDSTAPAAWPAAARRPESTSRSGRKSFSAISGSAMDRAAVILRVRAGHRIARHGHQRDVARIDERGRQHGQRGFRADAVIDFRGRIEPHAEIALHEPRDRFLIGGDAVVGVAAVFGPVDLGGQCGRGSGRAPFRRFRRCRSRSAVRSG